MAIKMKSTGGSIDAPAAGTYLARLVGLINLDHQPGFTWDGGEVESQYKMTFTYEIPSSRTKDDKPHWVSEDLKISDHERSKMYSRVKALDPRGELLGPTGELHKMIGIPCMVSVELNKKGYPFISGVTSAPEGFAVPELENDPVLFDFEEPDFEVYKRLPEFVQNKLKASLNYEGSELQRLVVFNSNAESSEADVTEDVPF